MEKKPLVSIIMPVYNSEDYVGDAIKSILSQSFSNFEFLIFDDGSSDGSLQIIHSFTDDRIKVFTSKKNEGYVNHLNRGIKIAKGKYIARMDADDISQKLRLEKQVNFLKKNKDYSIVGTNFTYIDNKGKQINNITKPHFFSNHQEIYISSLFYNPFVHPSVVIRKKDLLELNIFYDNGFYISEDSHMWSRLLKTKKGYNLKEVLISYRTHPQQSTKTSNHIQIESLLKLIPITLKNRKINFNKKDLETHSLIPLGTKSSLDLKEINKIEKWLKNIRSQLMKQNNLDSGIIDKTLGIVWFYSCRKAKGEGIGLFKIYRQSSLSNETSFNNSIVIFFLGIFGKSTLLKKIRSLLP